MKLSEITQRKVEFIREETTVREAARRMMECDVGALPICTGDRIAGMVTDRDLVVRAIAKGGDPDKMRVAEVMTADPACCYEDDSIREATRVMSDRQVQRLLVLDHDKNLVGIVSIGDLARARQNAPETSRALEEIKAPTKAAAAGAPPQQTGF
jgi:CBS domain-containing protein